jgi:hypothetical protein
MEYVSRCPACSALVRRDQDWCTLCHEDLRPPEQRPSAAVQAEPATDPSAHELDGPMLGDAAADSDPLLAARSVLVDERPAPVAPAGKHARPADPQVSAVAPQVGHATPAGTSEGKLDDAEIAALIVQLAAESPDPVSGLMSRLPESQGTRALLALMVGGGLATILVGLSYVLGLFFN